MADKKATSEKPLSNCEESSEDDSDADDEVIGEMDVFISQGQADSLYLLQYPLRPTDQPLTTGVEQQREITAEFKPKQEKLQIKLPLNTSSSSFDKSRSEQIAVNCGASSSTSTSSKSKVAPFEKMMDYQNLTSSNVGGFHNNCYAIGLLQKGQMHLTPCKNIMQMRPNFSYLDAADARSSTKNTGGGAKGETAGGDSSQDDSDTEAGTSGTQVQTVRVKFKEESEWLRKRREQSYQYQQKIKDEEKWQPMKMMFKDDPETVRQRTLLLGHANFDTSNVDQSGDTIMKLTDESTSSQSFSNVAFDTEASRMLRLLAPKAEEQKTTASRGSSTTIPLNQLRSLPLPDQMRTLLTNVKVLRYSQLLKLLPEKVDLAVVLKHLQLYAQLVKGCWIVKSDILHPKGSFSPRTGASADLLCRARDYAMYKFTQVNSLTKRDILHAVKIPGEDVDDILTQLAKFKVQFGWHFMYPPDTEFIQNHPDIAQQQTAKWEAKFKELSQHLTHHRQRNVSSSGGGNLSPASRRRRTDSGRNSVTESVASDYETGLMSPPPARTSRRRSSSGTGQKNRKRTISSSSSSTTNNRSTSKNGASSTIAYDATLMTELKNFLYDAFSSKPVLSLARIILELKVKVSESPKDHPLTKCVDEKMIEECITQMGMTRFEREKGPGERSDRIIFAFTGGSWPELRQFLVKYLLEKSQGKKEKAAIRFNAFKQACLATLTSEYMMPSDGEIKQLILEYCTSKPGGYFSLQE